jgi:hypothetical protein
VEDGFLDLPCDWRFLPKLGPLRHRRAGLLFFSHIQPAESRDIVRIAADIAEFIAPLLVQRTILLQGDVKSPSACHVACLAASL